MEQRAAAGVGHPLSSGRPRSLPRPYRRPAQATTLTLALLSEDLSTNLGQVAFSGVQGDGWERLEGRLTAKATASNARLAVSHASD